MAVVAVLAVWAEGTVPSEDSSIELPVSESFFTCLLVSVPFLSFAGADRVRLMICCR